MAISFETRRVGDIAVVRVAGHLVEGAESTALQKHIDGLMPFGAHLLLNLSAVEFMDSSGLGLLVRYLTRTRNAHGNMKLCSLPPPLQEVLRVTRLQSVFDPYASEEDAIAAFYHRSDSSGGSFRFRVDILCVDFSTDVQAYVRELLGQAGFGVLTAGNLPDALVLLQATRPRLVVINRDLRAARNTQTAAKFNGLADKIAVVELPHGFSHAEAGQAGQVLVGDVLAALGPPPSQVM
ncbi:MAG TPA: anti-sigma factor antagonist [Vicinamibacterales bacterium]|nr:anti-sigma factor antagonist [Vicinamibacterales bacterium]